MDLRSASRPLPLVLIFLFAAVAAVDIVHTIRTTPEPPPSLLGDGTVTITDPEPILDLRLPQSRSAEKYLTATTLVGEQWSTPEKRGVWLLDDGATLDFAVTDGAHRVLILDCNSPRGKRRVTTLGLEINGIDGGTLEIEEGWRRYRLALPADAIRPGRNRIVFRLPDGATASSGRQRLLIRRFGLFLDGEVDADALDRGPTVVVDAEAETVSFRATASLETRFTLDDRVDALQFRYRFGSENGRAEVVVARPQGAGAGHDAEIRRSLAAAAPSKGRVRIPLHGRRGEFVLRISAVLEDRPARLNITALRLIEEGDPTRRPRGAQRRRERPSQRP